MPATEETYRKQSALHVVFAVSSIALALVTVWMILADHLRPWKSVQREFQQIETDKLAASEREKLVEQQEKSKLQIDQIDSKVDSAAKVAANNGRLINGKDSEIGTLQGTLDRLDTERKFKKAELDSQRSFYDGYIDRDERLIASNFLKTTIIPSEKSLDDTIRNYEFAVRALNRAKLDKGLLAAEAVEVSDPPPPGSPADIAGFKKGDVLTVEAFEGLRKTSEEAMRAAPGTAPKAIPVVVTRRDGKGNNGATTLTVTVAPIGTKDDRGNQLDSFETVGVFPAPLTAEVLKKRRGDLTRDVERLQRAREQKEAQYGLGTGLWGAYSRTVGTLRGMPIMDLAAPPTKIQQISLPDLLINYNFKEVPRYDRCTTCHLGIDRPGYDKTADNKDMPAVFKSHPHLTDGAMAFDPKGKLVPAGLYLDSNGPHGINKFGCTICHGGQGSGTSFTFASHTPNDLHEKERWQEEHGWYEMHHWDEPMLPRKFQEASCIKCHHMVTDVPQAKQLQKGYERITKYGCTGCHTIGGEGSIGPDLTDNRQVGPNLKHLGSKVTKDWALKWVKNPHAFRPDTRMPRFYEVSNNSAPEDKPKVNAEVHAITAYLFAASTPPKDFIEPPSQGDAAKGKEAFFAKGCMACHSHKDYDPANLPEAAKPFAKANYGPNLSNIAAKFEAKTGFTWLANWLKAPENYHSKSLMPNLQLSWEESADIAKYLLSVKPDTIPARWDDPDFAVPPVDSPEIQKGLNDLTTLYLSKSKTYKKRTVLLSEVASTVAAMSTDDKLAYVGEKTITRLGCFGCHNITGFETAKPIGTPLNGWGVKSPAKLDFAHIKEYLADHFTPLDPKAPEGHAEADAHGKTAEAAKGGAEVATKGHDEHKSDKVLDYDGTDEYYKEQLDDHTRMGFLYQKLHRPRSYDYGKNNEDLKAWDDRLRMPQFSWANDKEAVEEVMTFILGLTGERIPSKYMPNYKPQAKAVAQGERLIDRYNCRGCHVLAMPKYSLAEGTKTLDALPDFLTNVGASYSGREKDFLSFYGADNPAFAPVGGLKYNKDIKDFRLAEQVTAKGGKLVAKDGDDEVPVDEKTTLILSAETEGKAITIEGMPTSEDENKIFVQVWRPVIIRGHAFNVGDILAVDKTKVQVTPAEGGDFAWLYATVQAEKAGTPFAPIWNRLPPPLLREGNKAQTPWLTSFLRDPYMVRPATNLRMPKFHYGSTPEEVVAEGATPSNMVMAAREEVRGETRDLANYFAARDGAEFPYQDIPERERAYLAEREKAHKDYLAGGWQIITKGLCVQCHAIGQYKPAGGDANVNGPDLRQVAPRFRSGYLDEWLSQPARLVPFTAMPQNIVSTNTPPAPGVPKSFEGHPAQQVRAMRDTLLNYVMAVEGQLAGSKPVEPAKPAEAAPAKPAEGGQE